MKKITLILASAVAALTIFTGCNLFGPADNLESITGVLSEQEKNDDMAGTHVITTEDGDVYALSSTNLFLSSKQFAGNKVTVRGDVSEDSDIFMVDGVSVLEILEKEGGKANWIEYMNEDLGFKLKYYDDWNADESGMNSVVFTSPEEDEMDQGTTTFDLIALEQGEDVYADMNDYLEKNGYLNFETAEEKIGSGQMSAVKIEDASGSSDFSYFVERSDGYFYEILFDGDTDQERTFKEMLLEFQVIPMTLPEVEIDDSEDAEDGEPVEEDPLADADTTTDETDADDVVVKVPADRESITDDTNAEAKEEITKKPVFEEKDLIFDYADYASFESGPYKFTANYPKSWYYAGEKAPEDGVLHKYAFSDEEVDDNNEFASLKIFASSEMPSGSVVQLPNGEGMMKYVGPNVMIYVKLGDRVYGVEGMKELEEILLRIIGSVTPVA